MDNDKENQTLLSRWAAGNCENMGIAGGRIMDELKPAMVIENSEYIFTVYDMNSLYPQAFIPKKCESTEEE